MLTFFFWQICSIKTRGKGQNIFKRQKPNIINSFFINSYSKLTTEGVPKLVEESGEDPADGH